MRSIGFDASIMAYHELQLMYCSDSVAALLGIAQHRFFDIDAEMIWQPDAAPMIEHITRSAPIDLDLNLDLCRTLHEKWYHSVTKTL